VFQSTVLVVEENTTFGMSRHAGELDLRRVAPLLVGGRQWSSSSPTVCARTAQPVAPTRSDHHWNIVARHAPAEVVAGAAM